jgi:hypothetical protein
LLPTLLLCACDSPILPPDLNAHPTKSVTIRVFAPASLKIELNELWHANAHPFGTMAACNLKGGMKTPIYVPVTLKQDGGSYVGSFLEDRYLPSRCDWIFEGLFATSPSHDVVVMYSEMLSQAFPVENETERSGEVWCGIDPVPTEPHVEVCSSLDYFAQYSNHFPPAWRAAAAAAVDPKNFKFNQGNLSITPGARSVELHYHDYDSEVQAATGNP